MSKDDEFLECAGCVCAGVRRAARALTQHYQRHMRGTGLRDTQFSTLAVLAGGGAMPVGRLARRLGVERTTLTRNVKLLEKKGWVTSSGEADARVHVVTITPAGRAAAHAALPHWRAAQASVGPKLKELRLAELLARAA
ncbi:MAG TPA: MarR family winged helix-turn-helix transcriptional regulator [Stellaceae bacterium]